MRENLLKKQPTWGLRRAQGTGQKSATPATLTKVILVLLTTFLLPSAAWGVDEYTLGSGETLTYNNDSRQYSSRKGLVWNVTLTNIPNSVKVPKYNDNGFMHFCELRLTSPIPYKGKMTGFTFSGTVSIKDEDVQNPEVDQILVYKSSSASDFSGRTLIGEITKSGSNYTYASHNSDPLNNDYIQVVFYRETVNEDVTFSANKITNITMTFEGTSYGIKVGNQRVTSNNYDDIFKDGGKVSYNSADNTLTLNGATIDGCIRYSGTNGLNIQFEGNNTITAVDSAAIWTVYDSTPSQLPSLILSGSGNAKLSSGSYVGYSAIAGFSQINGGLSAAYLVNYAEADFTSLTGGEDIIICNGSPYGFYVGGTIVTASNKATVLGSGVDFTPATSDVATLTFSDKATIPGELEWDINNALKIQLSGANAVQGCIHSNKDVALSFSYPSGTNNSSLTFGNSAGTQSAISGFTEVTFPDINSPGDNKLSFDENVSYNTSDKALKNDKNEVVTSSHISYHYGLTIAGVAVTSINVGSDGTVTGIEGVTGSVKYDNENHILTLTDAKIEGTIKWSVSGEDLTIEVNGTENSLITTDSPNIINNAGSCNLHFTKGITQKATLTLNNGIESSFGNSSSPDELVSGLYFIPGNEVGFAVTTEAWNLKVFASMDLGLTTVHNLEGYPGYKDNISGETTATIKFDGEQTLTINGGSIPESTEGENSYTSIISGLDNLTIKLSGDGNYQNTISGKIKSTNSDAKLTFTSEDDNSLFLGNGSLIEGFKGNPSFKNGLVYLPYGQSVGVNIKKLNIPSMRLVDGNLTLDNYGDGENDITCAYTIEYTDGTKETGEYNPDQPKAINKPCVVTAHAVYEDIFGTTNTGDDAVGKYFGASQKVFTAAIGDKIEGTDWFVPAISTDDGLSCDFTSESGVFTSENSVLSAVESGTGIVSATLEGPSNTPYTILNGSNAITLEFNVGEDLDEYFVDDNEYGTYYNEEENITYAVPEGMKAYIIKSVSDDGTVDLAESTVLSPKTPLLLKKGTAKSFTKISTSTGSAPSGNILKYAADWDQKPSATRSLYVLYNDKFVKVTNNTSVRERKCYLELSGSAGTRGFYNIGGGEGSTGIYAAPIFEEDATETGNSKGWHDLQGRKLQSKPTKAGLYILNGKKVVIK